MPKQNRLWEELAEAIGDKKRELAQTIHRSYPLVVKWCEPNEEPTDSGTRSPYETFLSLWQGLFLVNPAGAELLWTCLQSRVKQILTTHSRFQGDHVSDAELHKELSEVMLARLQGKSAKVQRKELLEAHTVIERALRELDAQADNAGRQAVRAVK